MSAGSIAADLATLFILPVQVADGRRPPQRETQARSELTEGLAVRILEHINTEGLAAGTHVTAQELADRFNVSRSPVNQALRLLHEKGVLAHKPNRGYFVGQASSSSPQELGLTVEDELSRVYLQIADDRLHGHLPAQVSESLLRERYEPDPGTISRPS